MYHPNHSAKSIGPARVPSPWGETALKLERCEERLVFSALPWVDLSHHLYDDAMVAGAGENAAHPLEPLPIEPTASTPTIPLANAAHQQTGWNEVQRLFGLRGEHQTVAVIDSGIAWDHVALGKGFGPGYRVVGGWDFAENDARPYDDAPAGFHGTHVSGIIGAEDSTRPGVASGVDLVALRVFDDNGKGQLAWTENALRWVHQNRNAFASPITTVNLSLGSTWNAGTVPSWGTLEDELLQLQQDGIVVVASAGNSFKQYNAPGLSYPAASPYVIPVSSVDANGQLSEFSQRHERAIAAPGRQITSTIPDHVLGVDGKVDDWSVASGTSMAAPYVAGSAVLVRQAMEMVGRTSITPQEIYQWMTDTADQVWDAATQATYDRLNLSRAIGSLFPTDNVGDHWNDASRIDLQSSFSTNGWLNSLGDRDVFRFTPAHDGVLQVTAESQWLQGSQWTLWVDGQASPLSDPSRLTLDAGRSYGLAFSDPDQIGSYQLNWSFVAEGRAENSGGTNQNESPNGSETSLGTVNYRELNDVAGKDFSLVADRDGTLTFLLKSDQMRQGALEVRDQQGHVLRDSTFENGEWRIDVEASAGSRWIVHTPSGAGSHAQLILANVLDRNASNVDLWGTSNADSVTVDLSQGVRLQLGEVTYAFADHAIRQLNIDLGSGGDSLRVIGSQLAEKVDLAPGQSSIENQRLSLLAVAAEEVYFSGTGGPDRIYLDGSTGDDTLIARPRDIELTGPGFRFHVDQVERTYVNATQGGQDFAYFYDSAGDDRLSVRPQFSSMSGKDFFNYAAGIERVYAYSNGGGNDSAVLYDSAATDAFFTSGDVASIVGPGFYSYTRFFESVEAISSAGGKDTASVYAGDRSSLLVGSDITGYQDAQWMRIARAFASAKTYVDNQLMETKVFHEPMAWQSHVGIFSEDLGSIGGPPLADKTDIVDSPTIIPPSMASAPIAPSPSDSIHDAMTINQFDDVVRLEDVEESPIHWDLDWLDPLRERSLLDAIFRQHGEL